MTALRILWIYLLGRRREDDLLAVAEAVGVLEPHPDADWWLWEQEMAR